MPDDMMTTTDLVSATNLLTGEVDVFGIARWRTPDARTATILEREARLLGFSAITLRPDETWHKMYSVSAWGQVRR